MSDKLGLAILLAALGGVAPGVALAGATEAPVEPKRPRSAHRRTGRANGWVFEWEAITQGLNGFDQAQVGVFTVEAFDSGAWCIKSAEGESLLLAGAKRRSLNNAKNAAEKWWAQNGEWFTNANASSGDGL